MLAKLHTFSLLGIDAVPVEVEVDVSPTAMPKTILVGLPEAAVRESRHRVDRAMVNSGVRPAARPHRDQPGPGRTPQAGVLLRPADLAGRAGRQRPDRLGSVCRIRGGRRTVARRGHAQCQRRTLHGHGGGPANEPARDHRPRRECRRSGGGRRYRCDPRLVAGRGGGFLRRAYRDRSRPLATGRTVQFPVAVQRRLRRRARSGDGQAGADHRRRRLA